MSEENLGSIEKAIQGDYEFSIGAVLSEAWDKTRGAKWIIHLAFFYYFLVMAGVVTAIFFMATLLFEVIKDPSAQNLVPLIMQLGLNIVALPLAMGVAMLGIKRAVDAPIKAESIFAYYSKMFPLFATMILMYILISIGFLLFILPGIYLAVAYYMAMPLVAEKDMSPWQALETSRKAVTRRWFSVFGLFFVMGIIIFVSAIPLGLGMIWTLPMMIIAFGILYRNMFGVAPKTISA